MISEKMNEFLIILQNAKYGFDDIDININELDLFKNELNELNQFINSVQFLNEWKKIFNKLNRKIEIMEIENE